jgi:hypothetical protein
MSFIKYRIKMLETFKDGNILEGRTLKTGEILEVDESVKNQIWSSSGGMIEVLGQVIPNPKKEEEKSVDDVSEKSGGKKNARKS